MFFLFSLIINPFFPSLIGKTSKSNNNNVGSLSSFCFSLLVTMEKISLNFSSSSRFLKMKTRNPCISLSEALDLLEDEEFACEDIQVVVLPPDPDQASDEHEGNDDDTAAPIVNDCPGNC